MLCAGITAELRATHPDTLLIIHRRSNDYAAVHDYRTNRGALRLAETREWMPLTAHWTRAEILHRSPRADHWAFSPSTAHTATDPE